MSSSDRSSQILLCVFISMCFVIPRLCEGFIIPPQQIILSTKQQGLKNDRKQRQGTCFATTRPSSVLFLSSSVTTTTRNSQKKAKKKKDSSKTTTKNNKAGKNKKNKNNKKKQPGSSRRRNNNNNNKDDNTTAQRCRPPEAQSSSRPVLIHYGEQRNRDANERRLRVPASDVALEEFVPPGCVMDRTVGDVEIVRSAKRFFSGTVVRQNRIDVERSGEDSSWDVEEEDDGFYEVVVPSETTGWRTQAKLVAAPIRSSSGRGGRQQQRNNNKGGGCRFGLYMFGTHQVMEIPDCNVHHPSINKAVEALQKATKKTGTPAHYTTDNNNNSNGGLRYAQFRVERTTGKISLVLVWGTPDIRGTQPALSRLTKELSKSEPNLWHSVWCHCNDGRGNNIFSRNPRSWHRLSGHEYVREPLPVGNLGWLYFSPLAFRQGNLDGFDIIANDVARAVPGGSGVCELYAGVGMLGLTSLVYHHDRGEPLAWVRCSDENPANPGCFSASVRSLPREITEHRETTSSKPTTPGDLTRPMETAGNNKKFRNQAAAPRRNGPKATYMVASAAEALKSGQALGADVLIVDPPRKGLEDEVLDELCKPFDPNQPRVESPDLLTTVPDSSVNWANDVETLIYVSCGFDALARDCEALLSSSGGWKLESATGYVLFPGSNHVETLCVFHRR